MTIGKSTRVIIERVPKNANDDPRLPYKDFTGCTIVRFKELTQKSFDSGEVFCAKSQTPFTL